MYLMGLNAPPAELTQPIEIAIRLNLALTWLALKAPGPALSECLQVEAHEDALLDAQRQKLYHRKLQAAYQLQLWSTAEIALVQCKTVGVEMAKWSTYQRDLQIRWKEVRGDFEWTKTMLGIGLKKEVQLYCSNYYGPLEIRKVPQCGRGMFVSRDVKAGELLLVERQIFTSHLHPYALVTIQDAQNPQGGMRISLNSAGWGLQAMIADHSRLLATDALLPGETRMSPMMSEAERLAALQAPLGPINVDDLHRKQVANSFGGADVGGTLFATSSMLNHSCLPTAMHMTVGNVRPPQAESVSHTQTDLLWARNDLPEGTELTFSSVDYDRYFASRALSMKNVWNFECGCQKCEDEGLENDAERERLMRVEWPKIVAATAGTGDIAVDDTQLDFFRAKFRGDKKAAQRIVGKDVQMPDSSKQVASNALRRAFCDKLEKTYRKDRKSPKRTLGIVYTETQDDFGPDYPRGCRHAVDVSDFKLIVRSLMSGLQNASPSQRRGAVYSSTTAKDSPQGLGPAREWD